MQPNPTSFQLYLKQNAKDQLVNWDHQSAQIRGYKLYWHSKSDHNWQATKSELELSHEAEGNGKAALAKKIQPLKPGGQFKGSIRFHDLTNEELGALLLIFNLGTGKEDIAYKIGMGKKYRLR